MIGTDIFRRTVGVNFREDGKAAVSIFAPLANDVAINLTIKKQKISLDKDEVGFWEAITEEIKPSDLYTILLNGQEFPDPASLSQPNGVHNASQAINTDSFKWTDVDWENYPLDEYIIYELHTGIFTAEGTFAALEQRLAYLKDLGVTAIEIMPVAQFPGNRNWGYDGVFPFAVQQSYGGVFGLQHLVDTCHNNGLAVILDVVYNHLGPEGNYLSAFDAYFTNKYKTPWGNAVNFDDEYSDGVRQYFIENVLMWFRDFHVDALRLDAVHAIKDFSPVHILREIKQYVNQLMAETGRKYYLIAELDLNDNRYINPLEQQGYGMDAQWIDEFHHALRVTATGEKNGYYADFNGPGHLAKSLKDAYVFDGMYSLHRKKTFGVKAENNEGKQFIVFSQNHDQVGNRMLGDRTSNLVSFEMQKLLAAAVLTSPYLSLLFMGEEYGETNPFLYFVSHTDPDLAKAVREGRKAEFAAFHAEGEAPDPLDEKTFERSKLQWNLPEQEPHKTMLQYYKALISLRKSEVALSKLDRNQLNVQADEDKQTLWLHRWHKNEHIVSLMNFSKQSQTVKLPPGRKWNKLFDSAALVWKGPFATPDSAAGNQDLLVQPESVLIYKSDEQSK